MHITSLKPLGMELKSAIFRDRMSPQLYFTLFWELSRIKMQKTLKK